MAGDFLVVTFGLIWFNRYIVIQILGYIEEWSVWLIDRCSCCTFTVYLSYTDNLDCSHIYGYPINIVVGIVLFLDLQLPVHSVTIISKDVSCDLWQIGDFLRVLRFPPPIKLTTTINWNIVEIGVKHHIPNPIKLTLTLWFEICTRKLTVYLQFPYQRSVSTFHV